MSFLLHVVPSRTCLNKIVRSMAISASNKKVYPSATSAIGQIPDGSIVLIGGFGTCGTPTNLILSLKESGAKDLTTVSNNLQGVGDMTMAPTDPLLLAPQVKKLITSYAGANKTLPKLLYSGKISVELTPQGTIAAKLQAGGAGIPAIYTPTGVGTAVQEGFPIRYNTDGTVAEYSEKKEVRVFKGRKYILEESIVGDFSLVKAWKGDTEGNLVFRGTSRAFNVECARGAKITIAEVEELVEAGEIKPEDVHIPGIFVHRIVKYAKSQNQYIDKITTKESDAKSAHCPDCGPECGKSDREVIARRVAMEFHDGDYVNLGIGIPTYSASFVPDGVKVTLHSENGLLGVGPYPQPGQEDPDLINAGKENVTYLPGSSVFTSADSFAMVRGGHLNVTVLGALQVAANGDLANWGIPGKKMNGMGGAMDLVAACANVIVATTHNNKNGDPKIVDKCTLPLTGKGVASMIITELAVFEVLKEGKGLVLIEYAEGVTVEEIRKRTGAKFTVSPNLRMMQQGAVKSHDHVDEHLFEVNHETVDNLVLNAAMMK